MADSRINGVPFLGTSVVMVATMSGSKTKWQSRLVQSEKDAIAEELDAVQSNAGDEARLQHALGQVMVAETDPSPRGQIRRFLFVMAVLMQHERCGGLTSSQERRAIELARSLLFANGIYPGHSKLSYLHGELHLVVSKIHRRHGEQWSAAWEQQMALYHAGAALPGGEGAQILSMAHQALRLGYSDVAIAHYGKVLSAEFGEIEESSREEAQLGLMRAQRLAGVPEEARAAMVDLRHFELSPETELACEWEGICLEIMAGASPSRMVTLVEDGHSHHQAAYLLEASLWVKTVASRDFMDRVILVRTMARKKSLQTSQWGTFYRMALILEQCYDRTIPLAMRLSQLGEGLAACREITTIDRELLVWGAAARFLARSSAFSLASLVLSEYVALSVRLTNGRSKDALGILSDVIDRSWFHERAPASFLPKVS